MDRALPRHHDAIAAQGDLRDDIGTIVVLRAHRGDLLIERHFLGDGLERGKGDREPGLAAHLPHPAKLVPLAPHVAGHFEHAMPGAAHRAADCDQFFRGGGGAGDDLALDIAMDHGAAGREAQRPGAHALFDDLRHLRDVIGGGDGAGPLALAQHIGAHGAMRDMGGDIDGAWEFLQRVEIFGEAFPFPGHAFGQRGAGNILDPFHQPDQPFVLVGARRREADPAIAHHHGGDPVPARGCHLLIPGRLTVVIGVDVDKAGGDEVACRIDLFGGVAGHRTDLRDQPACDGDVAGKAVVPGAIDDGAVANDQVECGHSVLLSPPRKVPHCNR